MKGLSYVAVAPMIRKDPRVMAMARALRKDPRWVAGCFPEFFGAVAEHAPDGNLSDIRDDELDAWAGDVRGFGSLLREHLCDPDGVLRAWHRYNGRALQRLQSDRERKQDIPRKFHGNSTEKSRKFHGGSVDITGTGTGTIPKAKKDSLSPALEQEFSEAWEAYPKRPGNTRKPALLAYAARRREGVTAESLLAAVKAYAAHCGREGTAPRFVMLGATFFGPNERWSADFGAVETDPLAGAPDDVRACVNPDGTIALWRDFPGGTEPTAAMKWLMGDAA